MLIIIPLTVWLIYKILPFNNDYYLVKETYECKKCHEKVTVRRGKSPSSVSSASYTDETGLHDFKMTDINYIKLVKVGGVRSEEYAEYFGQDARYLSEKDATYSFKGRKWRIKWWW